MQPVSGCVESQLPEALVVTVLQHAACDSGVSPEGDPPNENRQKRDKKRASDGKDTWSGQDP